MKSEFREEEQLLNTIILIVCYAVLIFLIVALFKNSITLRNQEKVLHAIKEYRIECIKNHQYDDMDCVKYGDMETYMTTFWRLWDWGYTRILPKDKFEIIKPYIK